MKIVPRREHSATYFFLRDIAMILAIGLLMAITWLGIFLLIGWLVYIT